ncbi:STAS domain-containing protein [Tateyamaria sp. syn59]|uniref:STAS domain-containing protein n=1 Tax=Tateyamaria sp. syn59 TaxID=2576942 RepID=UPI0011BFC978|nr:STAS domain-containing protein [Tateyamaria sp. syn59]
MNDVIPLPPRLDAVAAPTLLAKLLDCDQTADIRLDATETIHIGALGAQVLLSAHRTTEVNGTALSITNLQPRAQQQLTLMALTALMAPQEAI